MPYTITNYQTSNNNKKEKYKQLLVNYLESMRVTSGKVSTNTSWGWLIGKYFIKDYKDFLKKYSQVVKYGLPGDEALTMTEKPNEYSPIYVDLDFKVSMEKHSINEGRLYDDKLLHDVVKLYQEGICKYLDAESSHLICCVFEKDGLEDKKPFWGNGIHLLFPNIIVNSKIRHLVRNYVVCKANKMKLFDKYDNPTDDIIDIAVVERNNIMMFGSKKKESKYYYNYTRCIDDELNEIDVDSIFAKEPNVIDYVKMFSVRRKCHCKEYETILNENYNDAAIDMEFKVLGISQDDLKDYSNMTVIGNVNDINEARELVSILSPERAVNYNDWIRVGWCLYNIDRSLLDAFNDFSQMGEEVRQGVYKGFSDIKKYWSRMKKKDLTIRTLRYWAKEDSPIEYEKINSERFKKFANESLDGKDHQIAKAFFEKYKNQFVCASLEGKNQWWEFRPDKHRWVQIKAGYRIMEILPEEFANEWLLLLEEVSRKLRESTGLERNEYMRQQNAITKIINSLHTNNYCENLMKKLAIMFYDDSFNEKLDEINKNLVGFENGVYDLENNEFREGRPDDFISMSTKNNYIPYNKYYPENKEIMEFFEKVLPIKNVRTYFLRALSSCLSGENKDQKLFICTGCGSNGKSVTFDMVKQCLGDYYQAPRIELLTRKSQNAGNANEDLVNIKGRRCGVFQEPDNNETFNASVMKQLTAGNDTITARKLHSSNISFIPQMKYFLACNDLPNVKDNTDGTWRRLRVIGFISKFVNKTEENCRKDKHEYPIDDSISKKKEDWAPYLLSYLVHIYVNEYKVEGLVEPNEVKVKTDNYKSENDYFTQFFNDRIEITGDKKRLTKTVLFKKFREWYLDLYQVRSTEKKNKLVEFFDNKLDQKSSKSYYTGISFKSVEESDDESDDDQNNVVNALNV